MKNKLIIIFAAVIYFGAIGYICLSNKKTVSNVSNTSSAAIVQDPDLNNINSGELNTFKLGDRKKVNTNLDLLNIFSSNGNEYALGDPSLFIFINHDNVYFSHSFLSCYSSLRNKNFNNNNRDYKLICEELKNIHKTNNPSATFKDYKDYNYVYGLVADIGGNNYTSINVQEGGASGATFIYQDEKNAYYYSHDGILRVDKTNNSFNKFYDGTILDRPLSNKDKLYVIKEKGYNNATLDIIDNNTYKSLSSDKFYFDGYHVRLDSTDESNYYTVYDYSIYKNNKLLVEHFTDSLAGSYNLYDMFIDDKYLYIFLDKYNYEDGYTHSDEMKDNKIIVYDKNTGEYIREREYKKLDNDLFDTYLNNENGTMIVSRYVYNKHNVSDPGTYQILKFDSDNLEFEVIKEMTIDGSVSRSIDFKDKIAYYTHLYEYKSDENLTKDEREKAIAMNHTLILEIYDYANNEFITIPNVYYYYFNDLENRLYTVEIDEYLNLDLYYYNLSA